MRSASLHRLAGDGERSMSLLEQLLEEAPSGVERAEVLVEMSWPFSAEPRRWLETLTEALTEASADDAFATLILSYRGAVYCSAGNVAAGLVDARTALDRAERLDDPILLARTITLASIAEWSAWTITPGLLERGVEIERSLGIALDWSESPRWQWAFQLMHNGQIEQSRSVLAELHTATAVQGDEATRVMVLNMMFDVENLAGRWSLAREYADEATRLAEQNYSAFARLWTSNAKAGFDADLGHVEQARQTLHESLAISQLASNELFTIICMGNLGRIELALGNLEAAAGYLGELPERLLAMGMRSPTFAVWTDAIETLISVGELERAADYLAQYEETARSPTSWAFASALRCRILLEAQRGDLDAALALIESSRAAIDGLVYPFDRARVCSRSDRFCDRPSRSQLPARARSSPVNIRGARRWPVGEQGAQRVTPNQRPPAGTRSADGYGAPSGQSCRARQIQPRDRVGAVHGSEHGRGAPVSCLPQARRATDRTVGPASNRRG